MAVYIKETYYYNMSRIIRLAIILILAANAHATKELAVTIDDLPFLYGRYLSDSAQNAKFHDILKILKKHDIKVIGFVIGAHVNSVTSPLLDDFVTAGHAVGNHTFSHPDLNDTPIDRYEDDIARGEDAIFKWVDSVKYFRYPMLHQGPTEHKYIGVANYLAAHSYVNVPVTIDNDDWLYNRDFTEARKRGDTALADSIGLGYLAHMQKMTRYYDSIAVAKLHRDIKHILLIHMTELNALYLDTLLSWYESEGWKFVSPQEALTDPVYKIEDTYIGEMGLSWLLRF
ncbi:putative Polysaccharide deacetylase [Candidatus Zixiibacteriota bacterium]|nr:putative Polysaccharide deacetylase [candidate division Zixibacteria bacterium]